MRKCISESIEKSAACISDRLMGRVPFAAVVLGSGLGTFAEKVKISSRMKFSEIPGFPAATAPGHAGELCIAELSGNIMVLLQSGRFHYYEGYGSDEVIMPVRVYHKAGVKRLILTNAAGGINPEYKVGDIMLIRDHISFFCPSPLWGPESGEYGQRFFDMTYAYDREAVDIGINTAREAGIDIKTGVYAYTKGPMFETPAEIKALSLLGADAVGMSTVPEAIAANHCNMKVAGLSLITNMAAGITGEKISHQEVMETSEKASEVFSTFLSNFIINLHAKLQVDI